MDPKSRALCFDPCMLQPEQAGCGIQVGVKHSLIPKEQKRPNLRVATHVDSKSDLRLRGNPRSRNKHIRSDEAFLAASSQRNAGKLCATTTTSCTRLEAPSHTSALSFAAVIVAQQPLHANARSTFTLDKKLTA